MKLPCRFVHALLLLATTVAARAGEVVIPPDAWENPRVFGVNKLPPRSAAWSHPNAASALAAPGFRAGSSRVRCISGDWRFHWVNHPDRRPAGFEAPSFDDSAWASLPVPGCVELYGYGTPLYLNSRYPFHVDPPRVMGAPPTNWTFFRDRNPVSSYRRWIEIPADWSGQRVFLHVGAAGACLTAWVNGRPIGYSEDARLAAEFDITDAVKPGRNLIALQVLRHSDASYLEDQDIWRLSGIFRDVYVYTRPPVHLWDVAVDTEVDTTLRAATLRLRCGVRNGSSNAAARYSVRLTLRDPEGRTVEGAALRTTVDPAPAPGQTVDLLSTAAPVTSPRLWSHETPTLYTAVVELLREETPVEAVALRIGFRRSGVVDGQFVLNGRPMKFRGVNRHDWHPVTGYVVDEATMRDDIRRMKQANFNAVRSSHYPNDPRFPELCDELGLLLLDEANVESHGLSYHKCVLPGDLPEWEAPVVDRMRRMVIRDRSHACVVMWSLGNEAGYGRAIEAMAAEARRLDPQRRPIQYADMNAPCDVDSQTYPTPQWLVDHVNGRATRKGERGEISRERQHGKYPTGKPLLMNEYAWAGGNNLGNLQDYWDVIEAHPMLLGGFIWDWADKGLATAIVHGTNVPILALRQPKAVPRFHAYGGDFGDFPNDGVVVLNGLLESDRTDKPHLTEAAHVNRPIRVRAVDFATGRIRIENRHLFSDLSAYAVSYEWTESGKTLTQGALVVPACPAGSSVETVVPPPPGPAVDRHLTVRFALARETSCAPAGHIVACEQLAQHTQPLLPRPVPARGPVTLLDGPDGIRVRGPAFDLLIGRRSGMIERWRHGTTEHLARPFRLSFWRPPVTNDRGWKMQERLAPWRMAGANTRAASLTAALDSNGAAVVTAALSIPVGASTGLITYVVSATCSVLVRAEITPDAAGAPPADEVIRIGIEAGLPASCRRIEWHGLGPGETYADRRTAARVGVFRADAFEWNHAYLPPQETGHRSDVREARITDADGRGLRITAHDSVLGMNLWPWTAADLEFTSHPHRLPARDHLTLTLDQAQIGVGGVMGWGERPLAAYRLKAGRPFRLSFQLHATGK